MPEVVDDLVGLSLGAHCLGLYASRQEGIEQAARFLAGASRGSSCAFWVSDAGLLPSFTDELAKVDPERAGCVRVLEGAQVALVDGKLRPVEEIRSFLRSHPEGVTGGADTITHYWTAESVPAHLEYETWFQDQPRENSRFLCPYDLRRFPPALAPGILTELGRHHSHVALSTSTDPAVRLLQLFLFPAAAAVPLPLRETLRWARMEGLLVARSDSEEMCLSSAGEDGIEEWVNSAKADW